jgi:hypothetical protein
MIAGHGRYGTGGPVSGDTVGLARYATAQFCVAPSADSLGSGSPAACSVVGLADLLGEAPAQHEQVTKQGVDRVNYAAG